MIRNHPKIILCALLSIWLLTQGEAFIMARPAPKRVHVTVNPTVETIATLMNQLSPEFLPDSATDPAGYRRSRLMRINYDAFRPWVSHPAVAATKALSDKIGTGVYLLGLYSRPLPDVGLAQPVSALILHEIHPNSDSASAIVLAYLGMLSRFYREAGVARFMAQHRRVYEQAVTQVRQNCPTADFVPTMETYYGSQKAAYILVVMPFFISGWGMGWQVGEGTQARIYNISAPCRDQTVRQQRVYDPGYNDAEAVRTLAVHEFGHSFINPYTMLPATAEQINQYSSLFRAVPGQAQYTDWLTLFNELTVRAGEIRIARAMNRPDQSRWLRKQYANWPYLDHFTAQLAYYEQHRARYPTFTGFLPTLINSLAQLRP